MIKISKSVEYSILALKFIGDNEIISNVSSRKISDELTIPYDLLSKLLQKLVKQGIIKSQQGKYGGYNLLISQDKLTILQIIDALDEKVQLTNCSIENASSEDCSRIDDCYIRSPFINLQNKINSMFESITLKELTT
jgi:Rrf2 family protein